jgi:hypothetical protein
MLSAKRKQPQIIQKTPPGKQAGFSYFPESSLVWHKAALVFSL